MLGGGGSILAVPLLVYVAGLPAKEAIATSLLVVGTTSAVAVLPHARAGRVRWRTGLIFGVAGMAGAYAGGRVATYIPGTVLLTAFALMMLATAVAMIRGRRMTTARTAPDELPVPHVVADGIVVGLVTGLVGAGGGFLVVPALVLLGGLSMPVAVGTSLVVIAMKSSAGFAGYLHDVDIHWGLAAAVTAAAVLGSLAGGRLAGRIPETALRRAFGWFVVAMGVFVLARQLPADLRTNPLLWTAVGTATAAAGVFAVIRARSRHDSGTAETAQPTTTCCGPTGSSPASDAEAIREQVRARYADAASRAAEGQQCGPNLYLDDDSAGLPEAALRASLACGNPLRVADPRPGETVLDLGSGGGVDVLLSARRVGPTGHAHGLDRTDEMLDLARRNAAGAGATNVMFHKGHIEAIPLPDASVDVVMSNCVINLSADKPAVFAEIHRVLRPGGRLGVSDIVADDELGPEQRTERGDWAACVAGALSRTQYIDGLTATGFTDVTVEFTDASTDGIHAAIIHGRTGSGGTFR